MVKYTVFNKKFGQIRVYFLFEIMYGKFISIVDLTPTNNCSDVGETLFSSYSWFLDHRICFALLTNYQIVPKIIRERYLIEVCIFLKIMLITRLIKSILFTNLLDAF